MKIVVFSNSAWDDTNATGNTLSNVFGGTYWKSDEFYNIYMRNTYPNNKICKHYYQLLLTDMIKKHFKKEKIGKIFNLDDKIDNRIIVSDNKKEKKIIDIIHKFSLSFVYYIADVIYRKRKWINKKFKTYIDDINPDIFYAHLNNFAMLSILCEYMKKNTNAKIVLLLTDDLYGDIDSKPFYRRKKMREEYGNIIKKADKIYAISDELKEAYSKIFKVDIDILHKGCTFDYPVKKNLNEIIRFVYAGNLFYGRDEILSKIGLAIKKNNDINSQRAFLEIYTGATIDNNIYNKLNIENASAVVGKRDYNQIKKIMNNAEYNLQVESFEKNQIDLVKYSFSTKIIDCLQSGSSVLAIGPIDVSSMKYIMNVPGVNVILDIKNIESEVIKLINNKEEILVNSKKIRKFAEKNLDLSKIQEKVRNDFFNIIGK